MFKGTSHETHVSQNALGKNSSKGLIKPAFKKINFYTNFWKVKGIVETGA